MLVVVVEVFPDVAGDVVDLAGSPGAELGGDDASCFYN